MIVQQKPPSRLQAGAMNIQVMKLSLLQAKSVAS